MLFERAHKKAALRATAAILLFATAAYSGPFVQAQASGDSGESSWAGSEATGPAGQSSAPPAAGPAAENQPPGHAGTPPKPPSADDQSSGRVGPSRGSPSAVLIPIHGAIDPFMSVLVRRGVAEAERREADFIIVDIDTFGGRVDTALQIANTLSLTDIETVAYVGNRPQGTGVSWSAGALISLACNRIFMAPGTSIGAAAPVLQGPGGQEAASEKTVSAVRGQMAALAEKNGHPTAVARAMVDESVTLVAVEVDGERRLVTGSDLQALRRADGAGEIELTERETISEAGKLLTLTAGEMERYGVSRGTPATLPALEEALGIEQGATVRLEVDAADRAVAALTSTGLTSLLILAGLIALFFEITSPGFGLPGTIALACFGTLFTSNLLLGRVGSIEIVLFVAGLALLIFEIFVIPGFGVAGISGIVAMALSLILAMQEFVIPQYDWQWEITGRNALVVGGSTIGAILLAGLFAMLVKDTRIFQRLTLAETEESAAGYTSQESSVGERYLNRSGTARTDLRPVGNVLIGNDVLQAETEGDYVQKGSSVRVVRVDGNRIVVRKV